MVIVALCVAVLALVGLFLALYTGSFMFVIITLACCGLATLLLIAGLFVPLKRQKNLPTPPEPGQPVN